MKRNLSLFLTSCIHLLCFVTSIHGCTEFRVISKNKSIIIGRSMEWGDDMHSHIMIQSRDKQHVSSAPDGTKGLQWKSQYGFVYFDAYGIDCATDGINEKGLSVGVLFFPGYAEFQTVPKNEQSKAITYIDFVFWMLGNFETTAELRKALKDIYVWEAPIDLPQKKNLFLPVHFGVYDAYGSGIVIEYTKEGLKIFDNEIGVLTNSPSFDWHMINLRNYVGFSQLQLPSMKMGDVLVIPIGRGIGLRGIPGDPTPPSRFVRAATMVHFAKQPNDTQEAVTLASHILNTVDIPLGTVQSIIDGLSMQNYAQWIVIKDLTNKHLYFRSYKNSTLRKIDITKLDLTTTKEKKSLYVEEGALPFVDVTNKFITRKKNNIKGKIN